MRYLLFIFSFLVIVTSCKSTKNSSVITGKKYQNIKIFEQETPRKLGPCEPSIFINPKNPKNIVAGSVLDYAHTSFDGGKTWSTQNLSSNFGVYGDPCIVANNDGDFFYFHLSDPEGTNWSSKMILDQLVVQQSYDGGKTWSNGNSIGKNKYPKQQDKEWAVVNPFNNEMYITWTEFDKYGSKSAKDKSRILFSKSSNKGKDWSKPTVLSNLEGNALDDNKTTEGAVPSVGPNGEIYCAWSVNNSIYFDKSLDGGKTWLKKDIEAVNNLSGWDFGIPGLGRANGMPITAVDLSNSKYKGTIYINYCNQDNGKDDTDVYLVKSTNNGNSWSKPIRVNQDKTISHQFFTWMSVDPKNGYIYIVYYDRSKYTDYQTDVVLAVSKDGGNTFKNTTISDSPFKTNEFLFFGDYNNIQAYNGIIRPIWTRFENGKLSVWTCLINEK